MKGKELLYRSCAAEFAKLQNDNIIQDSFKDIDEKHQVLRAKNGFVDSVVTAYNGHHHLVGIPFYSLSTQP